MTNKVIHFEEVFEQAEKLAAKKLSSATLTTIITDIKAELDSILQYDAKTELSNDTKRLLKHRSIGSVLFLLSAISQRENINTWLALVEETKFEEADANEISKTLEQVISAANVSFNYNPPATVSLTTTPIDTQLGTIITELKKI